ncbi:hypothetical protein [Paraflavitalea speifideaquila]|uniref:rhamnogalacturonan lyase family protein n=1 Tax=Paraflavitalea speifideaquila TaxID=3076558 RepID=UPI0028EF961D|nr:hypothetical protein [Paraflavitalea speifideiaquila]
MDALLLLYAFEPLSAQRQMEWLGRGVHAITKPNGQVFVSWRLLGTDPADIAFNVYRVAQTGKPVKLNQQPITAVTSFEDSHPDTTKSYSYFIKPLLKGKEKAASAAFVLKPGTLPYVSLPLQTPAGYAPNDASVGDLDGDGEYEIILHQTGRAKDNSQAGITDPPIFQAYKMDGTLLWTINLGKNIREGAHYTQFMVYDLDGDGRAEIAMKTADGSMDAQGKIIGDSSKDYRNERGYILAGPEYLTIFDGLTGAALATTAYIPARHPSSLNPTTEELKSLWGDGYGNRMDRFLACIAYLDGIHPSLVMCRGYYTRTVLAAWDWKKGQLTSRWVFDTNIGNPSYAGQGNHNLTVADVDGDGKDEIVYGAMTIDDNGKGLYTTGLGHGDALHVTDLDPTHPGMEVFDIQERFDDAGANFSRCPYGRSIVEKGLCKSG